MVVAFVAQAIVAPAGEDSPVAFMVSYETQSGELVTRCFPDLTTVEQGFIRILSAKPIYDLSD